VSDTAIREVVIRALAIEGGWFDEHIRQRDIEKAKKLILLGYPIEDVAEAIEHPIDMHKVFV